MGSGDAQRLITELRTAWRVARERAAAGFAGMTASQVEAAAAQDGDYLAKRETVSEFLRRGSGRRRGSSKRRGSVRRHGLAKKRGSTKKRGSAKKRGSTKKRGSAKRHRPRN